MAQPQRSCLLSPNDAECALASCNCNARRFYLSLPPALNAPERLQLTVQPRRCAGHACAPPCLFLYFNVLSSSSGGQGLALSRRAATLCGGAECRQRCAARGPKAASDGAQRPTSAQRSPSPSLLVRVSAQRSGGRQVGSGGPARRGASQHPDGGQSFHAAHRPGGSSSGARSGGSTVLGARMLGRRGPPCSLDWLLGLPGPLAGPEGAQPARCCRRPSPRWTIWSCRSPCGMRSCREK